MNYEIVKVTDDDGDGIESGFLCLYEKFKTEQIYQMYISI